MIEMDVLLQGFSMIFNLNCAIFLALGMVYGILCGAIPGLTPTIAIATLVPVTYPMEPITALVFLSSTYAGSTYGGAITAILINTPGTPSAAATCFDGYPMAKRGEAERALGLSLGAAAIGGAFSYTFLLLGMYPIAYFAIKFGAPEMFLLTVMGLSVIASLGKENFWKAVFSGLFGILIANFGIAPTGMVRSHLGTPWLLNGAPQIPTMIGLLAFSELFNMLNPSSGPVEKGEINRRRGIGQIMRGLMEPFKYLKTTIISSVIGTFVGALPAAGSTIAAFLAYNQTKQTSKNPDAFGKGNPEGIIAPGSAGNASTGGALTTMLAFGIPGSGSTAIMLGAMMLHGLIPGPRLFVDQMPIVYGLILALLMRQVVMIVVGVGCCKSMSAIIDVPTKILAPIVAVFCVVGSFALRGSLFDVIFMATFGIIGYFMKKSGYSVIAMVLGLVLGQLCDNNLLRTVIRYKYNYSVFLTRPISLALTIMTLIMIFYPIIQKRKDKNEPAQGK